MDYEKDLINQFRQQQEKYVYYVVALAVTCIGFSVIKTTDESLTWLHLPLGIAVLCWSVSIYCGLAFIKYTISGLYNNKVYLDILHGRHVEVGNHPQMIEAAASGVKEAMETNSNRAGNLMKYQSWLFYIAVLSFLAWHVCIMINK